MRTELTRQNLPANMYMYKTTNTLNPNRVIDTVYELKQVVVEIVVINNVERFNTTINSITILMFHNNIRNIKTNSYNRTGRHYSCRVAKWILFKFNDLKLLHLKFRRYDYVPNTVTVNKFNTFSIFCYVYFCTCHFVFKIECWGGLGACWRAVSRTTSDYSEPRYRESFVMNSGKKKQIFP